MATLLTFSVAQDVRSPLLSVDRRFVLVLSRTDQVSRFSLYTFSPLPGKIWTDGVLGWNSPRTLSIRGKFLALP